MKAQLSLLENPRDVRIGKIVVDGRVTNMNDHTGERLGQLYKRVAHNAILNASGRADDVRCYPGTREEVIQKIEDWKDRKQGFTSRVMWLSGPAGAGKSAIVQTVAEVWKKRGIPAASFFFFRADSTRNNSKPIVATLLYQLFHILPALKRSAAELLSENPLMLEASVYDQFDELITTPARTMIHQPSFELQTPIVLLIDGLDECISKDRDTQERLLEALQNLVTPQDSPFIALVASRPEPNLVMAFKKLAVAADSIFLDDEYRPENDIRRFVVAKFREIKATHHLSHNLHRNWPLNTDIDNIVTKSSGQFIYATTVMRFLENSPESPDITLEIVQGVQPFENHSPFAQIDAMYSYIFSQARHPVAVKKVFAMHFISTSYDTNILGLEKVLFADLLSTMHAVATVESLISALTSIVRLERNNRSAELFFYHASLGDFLLDKSRSGVHFVDMHAARVKLNVDLIRSGECEILSRICVQMQQSGIPTSHSDRSAARSRSAQLEYAARLNADTAKEIYDQLGNSDINQYKKFLRRWVFLTVFYKVPFPLQGKAYPYYDRYKSWTTLELRFRKLVGQGQLFCYRKGLERYF